jgi:hypothetical protein
MINFLVLLRNEVIILSVTYLTELTIFCYKIISNIYIQLQYLEYNQSKYTDITQNNKNYINTNILLD